MLSMTSAFSLDGQQLTQTSQPMQSSGETCRRKVSPASCLPVAGLVSNSFGAFLASASFNRIGLMAACGQTSEHWLHWMQFSLIHLGTKAATPRFSYMEVADGKVPSSLPLKALTGRLSPSSLV